MVVGPDRVLGGDAGNAPTHAEEVGLAGVLDHEKRVGQAVGDFCGPVLDVFGQAAGLAGEFVDEAFLGGGITAGRAGGVAGVAVVFNTVATGPDRPHGTPSSTAAQWLVPPRPRQLSSPAKPRSAWTRGPASCDGPRDRGANRARRPRWLIPIPTTEQGTVPSVALQGEWKRQRRERLPTPRVTDQSQCLIQRRVGYSLTGFVTDLLAVGLSQGLAPLLVCILTIAFLAGEIPCPRFVPVP